MITLLLMFFACGDSTTETKTTETTQQTNNVEAIGTKVQKPVTTPANTSVPKTTVENNSTATVNDGDKKVPTETTTGDNNATND